MTERAPETALLVAGLFGTASGTVVYLVSPSGLVPGARRGSDLRRSGVLHLAFDVTLLGTRLEFTDRPDRAGYAVGLFGVSVGPLALGEYAGLSSSALTGVVVWQFGLLAFLLLSAAAARRRS